MLRTLVASNLCYPALFFGALALATDLVFGLKLDRLALGWRAVCLLVQVGALAEAFLIGLFFFVRCG